MFLNKIFFFKQIFNIKNFFTQSDYLYFWQFADELLHYEFDFELFSSIYTLCNIKINFNQFLLFYVFSLSLIYLIKNYLILNNFLLKEFPIIFIIFLIFLYTLFCIQDLLLLYFSLEIISLLTYLLLSFTYNNFHINYEGVLKYFILNSLASIFLLFGISLLYYDTLQVSYHQLVLYFNYFNIINLYNISFLTLLGFIMILISFVFKLGLFPCTI
jgi:NADH:ubiquinone oxidoreductase subunit 2 (subunit N)